METVDITISIGKDGFYSAQCNDYPSIFGGGETPQDAIDELRETLRIIKEEIGRNSAHAYPDWLDREYEFQTHWDVRDLMAYYAGIITPTALGRLSGINPKQVWSYMHGTSKPRRAQLEKMQYALRRLGNELTHTSFC